MCAGPASSASSERHNIRNVAVAVPSRPRPDRPSLPSEVRAPAVRLGMGDTVSQGLATRIRVGRPGRLALVLALPMLAATCGGAAKPAQGPAANDVELGRDLAMVCAAPTRAIADPVFADTPPLAVVDAHLRDGLRSARLTSIVDAWLSGTDTETRARELEALIHEANLTTPCRLLSVWRGEDSFDDRAPAP